VSTAVTESGRPRPLVPGTVITLAFEQRESGGVMMWRAGCNHFGSPVRISATRLVVSSVEGTAMGCDKPREDQDEWVSGFFQQDPDYTYRGKRLSVHTSDTTISFRRGA
jgi:heat shock protein HslJ